MLLMSIWADEQMRRWEDTDGAYSGAAYVDASADADVYADANDTADEQVKRYTWAPTVHVLGADKRAWTTIFLELLATFSTRAINRLRAKLVETFILNFANADLRSKTVWSIWKNQWPPLFPAFFTLWYLYL